MSYGPQLPAHLLSKESSNSNTDDDDDEHEQSYGPKLPSTACRGPDPRRKEFSDSGGDNYGPKLPSKPCFGPQNTRKTELDFAAKEIKSLENLWTIVALVLVIFSFLIMFICLFSQVRSQS